MKAHFLDGDATISTRTLADEGILYRALGTAETGYRSALDRVKAEHGYVEEDVIALSPATPNLDAICAKFVDEHHHDDDEVRFVLEGEGIFDIRSRADEWMRIVVEPGDLIVVPKDRHHRFLLTDSRSIRCIRLFKDTSGWVPHYRGERASA
jgi:1,2-dihydroxy-3-keto-5-methylthiopentene dioxygenase